MARTYDAIVIGARCAGSPTAMLLAKKGHRVLLVDRDRFPSDTLSTHAIHPPGVARLRAWGLLDRLTATGCPPMERYRFDFGPFAIAGRPAPADGVNAGYGPRRTILDKLLVDAAAESGAEVRERFSVDEILIEDGRVTGIRGHAFGGDPVVERARIVIGADGRLSMVAKAVGAEEYHAKPPLQGGFFSYWRDLPVEGFEIFVRPNRGWAAIPTHDGLTLIVFGWPMSEFDAMRKDPESALMQTLELAPAFAERVRAARREAPYRGGFVPGYFRKPFGPGWALVGDAGYNKDPITAWGISDAFLSAELCAGAVHDWLSGRSGFEDAMAAYRETRDAEALPMYELTCGFATLEPPPPDMQQLLACASASREASDQFVSMMAGTLPVAEFFHPANVEQIMRAAAGVQVT